MLRPGRDVLFGMQVLELIGSLELDTGVIETPGFRLEGRENFYTRYEVIEHLGCQSGACCCVYVRSEA